MELIKCIVAWLVFSCMAGNAFAADTDANDIESRVKATYLYKFTTYVEWPVSAFPQSNAPFTIGVVGSDAIAANLKNLVDGHSMNNRALEVIVLKPNTTPVNVHILFIGKQENGMLKRILNSTQSQPVLTITESSEGLEEGSIINFVTDDDHVRFEVSVTQAERSGLKISARLLKVAQKVEKK